MRVLTTTMCYPSPDQPDRGIFVQRRAQAVAGLSAADAPTGDRVNLRVVAPQPWCPILRRNQAGVTVTEPMPAAFPRMFSIPVAGWLTDGWSYARALEKEIRQSEQPIDLIDAHFVYPDGVGAWLAGKKLGLPVVVTVRGKIVSLSKRALRRMQIARMLREVDARIAVSNSLADWVRKVAGSDLPVTVIPNGIDPLTFRYLDRVGCRSRLHWDFDARYLLSVGHLQKLKGFDRLIEIMPEVRRRIGDVRLMLAGSRRGEYFFGRHVRRMIDRCNAQSIAQGGQACIEFTGPTPPDQLNLMYNAADLVINASRSEGWSNAITEALSTGAPVIATNVGGNPEQICSPELGTVVPDGDRNALTEAVCQGLTRKWNRILISAHGGARCWARVAAEVRTVYAEVLRRRRAWIAQPIAHTNYHTTPATRPTVEVGS